MSDELFKITVPNIGGGGGGTDIELKENGEIRISGGGVSGSKTFQGSEQGVEDFFDFLSDRLSSNKVADYLERLFTDDGDSRVEINFNALEEFRPAGGGTTTIQENHNGDATMVKVGGRGVSGNQVIDFETEAQVDTFVHMMDFLG